MYKFELSFQLKLKLNFQLMLDFKIIYLKRVMHFDEERETKKLDHSFCVKPFKNLIEMIINKLYFDGLLNYDYINYNNILYSLKNTLLV